MGLVTPAVLPSSREDLEEKLALFARIPGVSRIQIDVVDGKFATPASWPYSAKATQDTPYSAKATQDMPYSAPKELEAMVQKGEMLPRLDSIEYEIDLMCLDPERAAALWLSRGATRIVFHVGTVTDLPRLLISARKRFGAGDGFAPGLVSYGLAIHVMNNLRMIEPCLGEIEFVQFMGIARIGQQGQLFDARVVKKIRDFRTRHPAIPVQVDGGVTLSNAHELIALGVTNIVVGSGIVKASSPAATFAAFEALESPYGV